MSASEHIHNVLSDSAQTLHALRVLRHHGLNEACIQTVFRAVVVFRIPSLQPYGHCARPWTSRSLDTNDLDVHGYA